MREPNVIERFCRIGWLRGVSFAIVLAAVLAGAGGRAEADRRIFGYTYPYMTLPQGGFELEHYLDARFREMDDPGTTAIEDDYEVDWEHQVEAEYGITDHLDFGFYNVFRQKPFSDLSYRGVKLRSRYRFFEEGEWFIDPAVYVEAAYKFDEVELEQRLILGKMLGNVEIALNLKFEEEFVVKGGDEFVFAFVPSLGVGYHFNENWAIGLEYLGQMELVDGEYQHFTQYVGPSISVAGNHFWWTIAGQYQVSLRDDEPEFQLRSIFAVVF